MIKGEKSEPINIDETIGEITHEKIYCTSCGRDLSDDKVGDVFIDEMLFDWFRYIFCNQQCRDDYINSK